MTTCGSRAAPSPIVPAFSSSMLINASLTVQQLIFSATAYHLRASFHFLQYTFGIQQKVSEIFTTLIFEFYAEILSPVKTMIVKGRKL